MRWRTSSFSGASNDCVELAWRTSTRTQGGGCVELAVGAGEVLMRDTKHRAGGTLVLGGASWRGLLVTARGDA